jgi:hypothetical protein
VPSPPRGYRTSPRRRARPSPPGAELLLQFRSSGRGGPNSPPPHSSSPSHPRASADEEEDEDDGQAMPLIGCHVARTAVPVAESCLTRHEVAPFPVSPKLPREGGCRKGAGMCKGGHEGEQPTLGKSGLHPFRNRNTVALVQRRYPGEPEPDGCKVYPAAAK